MIWILCCQVEYIFGNWVTWNIDEPFYIWFLDSLWFFLLKSYFCYNGRFHTHWIIGMHNGTNSFNKFINVNEFLKMFSTQFDYFNHTHSNKIAPKIESKFDHYGNWYWHSFSKKVKWMGLFLNIVYGLCWNSNLSWKIADKII